MYICMSKYLGKLGVGRIQSPGLHGKTVLLFLVALLSQANKLLVHGVPFLPREPWLDSHPPPRPLSVEGAEEAYLRGFWLWLGLLWQTIVFLPLLEDLAALATVPPSTPCLFSS